MYRRIFTYLKLKIIKFIEQPLNMRNFLLKIFLLPWSVLFCIAVKMRLYFYNKGFIKSYKVNSFVISIGGINWSGVGKTVLTKEICNFLSKKNIKLGVIVRKSAEEEAKVITEEYNDVEVVCVDRKYEGVLALKNKDVIVIDDGFQHFKIQRDIDIVVIREDIVLNTHLLLPAGMLREPLSHLKRAHYVLVNTSNRDNHAQLKQKLGKFVSEDSIFFFKYNPLYLWNPLSGQKIDLDVIRNKKVSVFCGVGNPQSLIYMLKDLGAKFMHIKIFPDHYKYRPYDLDEIAEGSKNADFLITTFKDFWRMQNLLKETILQKMLILQINLVFEDGFLEKLYEQIKL